jgi:hypothetical protein
VIDARGATRDDRPALRLLARILCLLLALFAVGSFLAFGIVLIAVRDAGERGAAIFLMVLSLLVLIGAVAGFRRLRPRGP